MLQCMKNHRSAGDNPTLDAQRLSGANRPESRQVIDVSRKASMVQLKSGTLKKCATEDRVSCRPRFGAWAKF